MICSIPPWVEVLPAINSNFTHHISAGLKDGSTITGQVAISHPSAPTALPDDTEVAPALTAADHDRLEDANLPGSLPALRRPNIAFSKDDEEDLPARIERVWYINPYGHEISPVANPKVVEALGATRTVIYSIGSLYTSIVPSLILRKVGQALGDGSQIRHKILILNSKLDRETGPSTDPMTAKDFVAAIARACVESRSPELVGREDILKRYVSHLIYLEGEGTPAVDVQELERLRVKCIKVQGKTVGAGRKAMIRYDEAALGEALEAIMES
jgi:2-phospho-L-lactate transferase/gluconeogenesis factor (CofD/UPF0052 family)